MLRLCVVGGVKGIGSQELLVRFSMAIDLRKEVTKATRASQWDFGNDVLYGLCRKNPLHKDSSVAIAKVWLIGRAYAAAIERRRKWKKKNDDFYWERVAPMMLSSEIDTWISRIKSTKPFSGNCENAVISAHAQTTNLFKRISGLEKRSLASKYLHFHAPEHVCIFDSRAAKAISKLRSVTGRARNTDGSGDNEYRKFFEKCYALRRHCKEGYGAALTPRQIDNLLLSVFNQ